VGGLTEWWKKQGRDSAQL